MAELSLADRFFVLKRDHFTCVYCGRKAGPNVELHVDHAKSRAEGGTDDRDNLVTSCFQCNNGKRGTSADHRAEPPKAVQSVFLGKFLHRLKDRKIHNQGHVESVDGAVAMVRWFSFMDGRPMNLEAVPLADLATKDFDFYDTENDWNDAYTRQCARDMGRNPEAEVEYQRKVRDLFRELDAK